MIRFRLTTDEDALLKERMKLAGTNNQEAFIRKMVLDGAIIRLDMPELKRMITILGYTGNNINQMTKRLHESGRIYETDLRDVEENQKKLIGIANEILTKIAALK